MHVDAFVKERSTVICQMHPHFDKHVNHRNSDMNLKVSSCLTVQDQVKGFSIGITYLNEPLAMFARKKPLKRKTASDFVQICLHNCIIRGSLFLLD